MKLSTLRRINSAIDSLSSSTGLTILIPGAKITADRLCSPYVSHREVRFEPAPYFDGRAIFVNRKYAIRIGASEYAPSAVIPEWRPGDEEFALQFEGGELLQGMINPLLGRLHEFLGSSQRFTGDFIRVEVAMRIVEGWNEDGTPRWKPYVAPITFEEAAAVPGLDKIEDFCEWLEEVRMGGEERKT